MGEIQLEEVRQSLFVNHIVVVCASTQIVLHRFPLLFPSLWLSAASSGVGVCVTGYTRGYLC